MSSRENLSSSVHSLESKWGRDLPVALRRAGLRPVGQFGDLAYLAHHVSNVSQRVGDNAFHP
jgi:hypothetical protein